jgi:hypothetical protein
MVDKLTPRTAIDRGPPGEKPIRLGSFESETLDEGGGDSSASDMDANVGGAPASAGLDSGGAVGVRRGLAVGRPGDEYDSAPRGETEAGAGSLLSAPPVGTDEDDEPANEDLLSDELTAEASEADEERRHE